MAGARTSRSGPRSVPPAFGGPREGLSGRRLDRDGRGATGDRLLSSRDQDLQDAVLILGEDLLLVDPLGDLDVPLEGPVAGLHAVVVLVLDFLLLLPLARYHQGPVLDRDLHVLDRKSTRLNSSHVAISY